MSNPSTHTQATWQKRSSIQDRVTIFSESPRRVICTVLHADRVTDQDMTLILAAPAMRQALQLADRALLAVAKREPASNQLLAEAVCAVKLALVQAGAVPRAEPPLFTSELFSTL